MSETQQTPVDDGAVESSGGPDAGTPVEAGVSSSGADVPEASLDDAAAGDVAAAVESRAGHDPDPELDDPEAEDDSDDSDEDDSAEDDADQSVTDGASSTARRGSGRGGSGTENLRRLEEEGEVAADYLEELLDIVDLDGDIDIDVENGRASVAIVAETGGERQLRRLVGPHGEVLEALQELSRLAVQARTGDRSRLMLDVAGFRAARRRTLEDLAARTCREVRRTGRAARLDPMTAFERKVVHDVVAGAGLVSESEGEEPSRRVVVHPAAT